MTSSRVPTVMALFALLALGHEARPLLASPEEIEFFEKEVRPVLAEHCFACHGPKVEQAGLRLDTKARFLKGSDNGPIVTTDQPEKSLLLQVIQHSQEPKMPPEEKLSEAAIAALTRWVGMGAPWPEESPAPDSSDPATLAKGHWSFQPIKDQVVPPVRNRDWVRSPVDAFVLSKLEPAGVTPSPVADRTTLLRRVTYDLTGLPPTPEETEAFLSDQSPDAFQKVVDRLLASPHYGERWARHWMDIARYAETKGYVFTADRRYPFAFTYRDFVIDSLNQDMPYDQFLMYQLAADQLVTEENKEPLAALGFLTLGRRFLNDERDIIDDRIDVVTRGLMGLTVACARCHDHKYDPIPAADYYSLYGVFASTGEPGDLPVVGPARDPAKVAEFEKSVADAEQRIATYLKERREEIRTTLRQDAMKFIAAAIQLNGDPNNAAIDQTAKKLGLNAALLRLVLSRWVPFQEKWLASMDPVAHLTSQLELIPSVTALPLLERRDAFDLLTNVGDGEVEGLLANRGKDHLNQLRQRIADLRMNHPGAPRRAMAMHDLPQPVDPVIFVRGNPGRRGDAVPRQFLAVLSGPERKPFTQGSGRLELARSIASPTNPLTARVAVNWVWMHLFGDGLVRTPSDFGLRGETPTHPELLDYLATRFLEGGWSFKKLHRLILLSSSYQQSSDTRPECMEIDPENRLLWRHNRRRLEFEEMRDSLLASAGRLDRTIGGQSVSIIDPPFPTRRTVYAHIDRQNLEGLFRTFDFPNPNTSNPRRFVTTVPQQSLYLMNSGFVSEQARELIASSTFREIKRDDEKVAFLYRRLFSRAPDQDELSLGLTFLANEASAPAGRPRHAWSYGFGEYDPVAHALKSFQPLPHWSGGAWRIDRKFPHPELGFLELNANGGHPGRDLAHSAIRRWTAPRDLKITIQGRLHHPGNEGDGVRGTILSSRSGELGTWNVKEGEIETKVGPIEVIKGESIDFILDCVSNDGHDSFSWAPVISAETKGTSRMASGPWDAAVDFDGPPPPAMTPWEKYAQALMMTNEFSFVD